MRHSRRVPSIVATIQSHTCLLVPPAPQQQPWGLHCEILLGSRTEGAAAEDTAEYVCPSVECNTQQQLQAAV
jgi:hypothetical protein